jgi:hypothetical protein
VAAFNWNPARHQLESVAALRWNAHNDQTVAVLKGLCLGYSACGIHVCDGAIHEFQTKQV